MRFLLLQIRNQDDPMRRNERDAFARALGLESRAIQVLDVLSQTISTAALDGTDVVLIGGSGNYSACGNQPWLQRTLEGLRRIYVSHVPLFASCWGFQALARALGGRVEKDRQRAEVGTHRLRLTDAGKNDPLFASLPDPFAAQMGHEDHVIALPPGAVLLASSPRVQNQAYTFADRPIYATQFHTELTADDLVLRLRQYPEYVELVTGGSFEEFRKQIYNTPECAALLARFASMVQDGSLSRV
jgi:GMP synthase (glutamine-hydrolysing)